MEKNIKIYNTPIILLLQTISVMFVSDLSFFVLLKLVDFASRDSLLVNTLSAKEELIFWVMIFQILIIIYIFFKWMFKYYVFKNRNLYEKNGIIFTSTRAFILSEIEGVAVSQGLLGKLLNFGSVKLIFAHNEIKLNGIPNPYYFVELIDNKKL